MYGQNLGLRFEEVVGRYPRNVALRFDGDNSICYEELNKRANQIARFLLEKDIRKNNVICISSIKIIDTFACILACLKIGAIYTIVDRFSPVKRLEKIITNCSANILFVDNELSEGLSDISVEGEMVLFTSDTFKELLGSYADNELNETAAVNSEDPAYIMYTSGSTGTPKGAVITHGNVLSFISWSRKEFSISHDDVFTNVNPLFFDNSVFDIYSSLFSGACLVPFDRGVLEKAKLMIALIDETKCTTWFSVPSMLIYLEAIKSLSRDNMRYIKRFIFGGEGYPKSKLKILYGLYSHRSEFVNVYGPTECTCICSSYRISDNDFKDMQGLPPLGKIIDQFSYRILDENDKEISEGETGELCLFGPNVGKGYYADPERTSEGFKQNPYNKKYREIMYKTGDLVKYDTDDDKLNFVGRKDFQIKHMGYRIELGEIESALNSIDYVVENAALYGTLRGLNLIVCVVCLKGDINEITIKTDLKRVIPDYMIPNKIFIVDNLSKNANGKIDRKKLSEFCFYQKR